MDAERLVTEVSMWDVPVVVFCVWTVVLVISSLIVLSCLRRETKKFNKRLSKAIGEEKEPIGNIQSLNEMLGKYVQQRLGQGILDRLASAFSPPIGKDIEESIRQDILSWFRLAVKELRRKNVPEKQIKRRLLSAIRSGLTQHPLDLRGSRRSLEAASLLLSLERDSSSNGVSILSATLNKDSKSSKEQSMTCPTPFCDLVTSRVLKCFSLIVSHPNSITVFTLSLSVLVWLYDCISDILVIHELWGFNLPLVYPTKPGDGNEMTYLSYQTLTVDLYAPLLLLVLLMSLLCCLLSCSCSRLGSRYSTARELSSPEKETDSHSDLDPTELIARYDFHLSQAVTSSLPQFVFQFTAYILILYMLENLKHLSVDKTTIEKTQERIDNFTFTSLWFSGLGSFLSLLVAQYTAFKIQHEHCMSLSQRVVYFLACLFNTVSMLSISLVFVLMLLLPCSAYIGRYHVMLLLIVGAALLGVAALVSLSLAAFSLDSSSISSDRLITRIRTGSLLTSFLRFSKSGGSGRWSSVMGACTILGKVLSLFTVSLFLPPSQILAHPFTRFYATSPRSPALHFAIAKQLITYNILFVVSCISLCVNINEYDFNYALSPATRNLLIYANIFGVPCLFFSLLILFKFYSTHDLWSSNGVHLVFVQDHVTICDDTENQFNVTEETVMDVTRRVFAEDELSPDSYREDYPERIIGEEDGALENPEAESTTIEQTKEQDEHNESTEADRMTLVKKHSKRLLKQQSLKIRKAVDRNKFLVGANTVDMAVVEVRGRWIDVSD